MKIEITWHRSPEIEGWLNRSIRPDQWEFMVLPVDAIDWIQSLAQQNREDRELHVPTVDSIAESIRAGQPLPALIIRRLSSGKLVVLNGNHRGAAVRKVGTEQVGAYVLQIDDETAYLLSATANAINGREAGGEFILRSAAYAVKVKGFPAVKVAPLFGLTAHQLTNYMQALAGQAMMKAAGRRDVVPPTKAKEIARLDQDQATYLAAELANPSVTAEMVRRAVVAIKSSPAAKQQEEVAAQRVLLAKAIEEKARVAATPRRRSEVTKALQRLNSITQEELEAAMSRADAADKVRLIAAMKSVVEAIEAVRHADA